MFVKLKIFVLPLGGEITVLSRTCQGLNSKHLSQHGDLIPKVNSPRFLGLKINFRAADLKCNLHFESRALNFQLRRSAFYSHAGDIRRGIKLKKKVMARLG
ncbi:hypothetical protein K0M31_011842 [Melipona bicolor]|uniref:Uncharacterized protein n=1 Tax=Melipona bicolor TaxID=60889 RepID=A0AA40GAJ8_9HYME|nr:hypothetical protein K0M31_011842 [Melipona bicolor]